MKFKLVVTYSDDKINVFERLLNSLKGQLENVFLVCVYQGKESLEKHDILIRKYIGNKFTLLQSERCSLSKARNIGLDYIYKNMDVNEQDFIMFPDDDCWYEDNTFKKISSLDWDEKDFYSLRVFDPYTNKEFGKRKKSNSIKLNYFNSFRLPISVGLVIKLKVFVDKVTYFNELLGVGTDIGSGEETEVVLKLLSSKSKGCYYGNIDVYHEIYHIDDAFIKKSERYALGQGYCFYKFTKDFSPLIIIVFIELLARSVVGYIISPKALSKMYIVRFKALVRGFVFGISNKNNN